MTRLKCMPKLFVNNALLCKKKMCSSSRIRDAQSCIELVDFLVALQVKVRLLAAGLAVATVDRIYVEVSESTLRIEQERSVEWRSTEFLGLVAKSGEV